MLMTIRAWVGSVADTLSRILKINVRFYGKAFSFLSFGYATLILRGLASTYLVARFLDAEVYGQVRYVIALYNLAGIFTLSGFGIPLVKGLARRDSFVARHVLRKILRFSVLGTVFLALLAFERWIHGERDVSLAVFASALFFVPYTLCGMYVQIYTGLERLKDLAKADGWSNFLYAIFFTLTLCISKNLIVLVVAYFLIDCIIRGWLTWRAYRSIPPSSETDMREYDLLGRHMNGVYVMQSLAVGVGQVLLQRFGGYQAVAAFSVATIIPEQVISLTKSLNGTLLQRLSRYSHVSEGHANNIRRQFWLLLFVMTGIFAGYAIVAPFVLRFLFPQYPDAILPSIVYATGFLGNAVLVGTNAFQAYGNMGAYWMYASIVSTVQLVSSVALVPVIGGWGAILSRVFSRFVGIALSYPSYKRLMAHRRSEEVG